MNRVIASDFVVRHALVLTRVLVVEEAVIHFLFERDEVERLALVNNLASVHRHVSLAVRILLFLLVFALALLLLLRLISRFLIQGRSRERTVVLWSIWVEVECIRVSSVEEGLRVLVRIGALRLFCLQRALVLAVRL
jgi:hypothetical protein